jgi:hypothetical protein
VPACTIRPSWSFSAVVVQVSRDATSLRLLRIEHLGRKPAQALVALRQVGFLEAQCRDVIPHHHQADDGAILVAHRLHLPDDVLRSGGRRRVELDLDRLLRGNGQRVHALDLPNDRRREGLREMVAGDRGRLQSELLFEGGVDTQEDPARRAQRHRQRHGIEDLLAEPCLLAQLLAQPQPDEEGQRDGQPEERDQPQDVDADLLGRVAAARDRIVHAGALQHDRCAFHAGIQGGINVGERTLERDLHDQDEEESHERAQHPQQLHSPTLAQCPLAYRHLDLRQFGFSQHPATLLRRFARFLRAILAQVRALRNRRRRREAPWGCCQPRSSGAAVRA